MRVREREFEGHQAIELVERGVTMVIVHDVGPRIAWFGRRENLLFWDREEQHSRNGWKLYGGHRLWLTRPGADESEETYQPDNATCTVRKTATSVTVAAPIGAFGIERAMTVSAHPHGFTIVHRIRNRSDMLWSGGAWALTCTKPQPRTRYRIPLGGGVGDWQTTTIVIPTRWGGTHTSRLDDSQFVFVRDAMIVRPAGREAKRMICAPAGLLEMSDRRGVFRKRAAYVDGASYPLATNLALYVGPGNFMVELETMSPVVTLAPGQSLLHAETWALA